MAAFSSTRGRQEQIYQLPYAFATPRRFTCSSPVLCCSLLYLSHFRNPWLQTLLVQVQHHLEHYPPLSLFQIRHGIAMHIYQALQLSTPGILTHHPSPLGMPGITSDTSLHGRILTGRMRGSSEIRQTSRSLISLIKYALLFIPRTSTNSQQNTPSGSASFLVDLMAVRGHRRLEPTAGNYSPLLRISRQGKTCSIVSTTRQHGMVRLSMST